MNTKVEVQASKLDTVKLVLAVALLLGGVVGFHYFADQSLLLRVIGMLLIAGAALFVALQTLVGRNTLAFAQEARTEVRKVVWPSRAEALQATLAVIVMVIVLGILLWLFDMLLFWAIKAITGQGA